ncbi:MAG: T9SS type A sorting domain-containing protein [Saprospiraceae bacterium]|nr:T9SS type A sorting domain-containing protein [Saprospiraceae bacterium]
MTHHYLSKLSWAILLLGFCSDLSAQITLSFQSSNVTCFGGNNGAAKVIASGGVQPYQYAWNNGATTDSIGMLMAGIYKVVVQDAALNAKVGTVTVTQPGPLWVSVYGQSQLCEVAPDGFAIAVASYGTPPYTYQWSNGVVDSAIYNLTSGTYTVTVTDAHSCTDSDSYSLNFWNHGLYLYENVVDPVCRLENGSFGISVYSGTAPYTYVWNTGDSTAQINGLDTGYYAVTVTDSRGCSNTASEQLIQILPSPTTIHWPITFFTNQPQWLYLYGPTDTLEKVWSVADTSGAILQGQGTDSILVQWNTPGPKKATCKRLVEGLDCFFNLFFVKVELAVGASEPDQSMFRVFPNPFDDYLVVQTDSLETVRLELLNASGSQVFSGVLKAPEGRFPTGNLPSGVYFLRVEGPQATQLQKIVKQ